MVGSRERRRSARGGSSREHSTEKKNDEGAGGAAVLQLPPQKIAGVLNNTQREAVEGATERLEAVERRCHEAEEALRVARRNIVARDENLARLREEAKGLQRRGNAVSKAETLLGEMC
ncbi:unnamed protein product, partial [Phaeothamnion confervicola]